MIGLQGQRRGMCQPHFQAKAARILDLYACYRQGQALREDEFAVMHA